VVYCSAECVYLSVGSTIKEKLHVHGTDNIVLPTAGDIFAGANLSQMQTVTKFFSAGILLNKLSPGVQYSEGEFCFDKIDYTQS